MSARFRGYQEEKQDQELDFSYLRRIWPFVQPYKKSFLVCLGMLVASFALELLNPYLLALIIDGPARDVATGTADDGAWIEPVLWLGLGMLFTSLGGIALGYNYAVRTARNGQRVIRDLRTHLFDHVLRLSPRFHDRNPSGRLVTRITSDVENLNELITTGVLQTMFDLLKLVGILVALFFVDLRLALFTLVVTPVVLGLSLFFRRFARRAYRRVRGRLARLNAFTAEAVHGVQTTRVFGQEQAVLDHFRDLNRDTQDSWRHTVLCFASFFAVVDLALRLSQVGLLVVGGYGILEGSLTVGVFIQFFLYFGRLTEPIKELGEKYNVLQSAFSSCERIFKILDEQPAPTQADAAQTSVPGPARLQFEQVSYAYVDDRRVLHEVDFTVEPGQTCAIVGPTGAGKSTILSMVSRMQDPDSGRVSLDGVPLTELDLGSLRRRIAIVQQDVFLFSGTFLENVRLHDPAIDEGRVADALRTVGAWDLVESHGGLHAPVEERGASLSQGERQLVAFARALAQNPDILLLDEATANIDSESEERIQRALETVLRGRTSLVVAHRLSTVRRADQILVVQGGRIVERGRHDELLAADGAYAHMLQAVEAG